jgi:hypothetical protein
MQLQLLFPSVLTFPHKILYAFINHNYTSSLGQLSICYYLTLLGVLYINQEIPRYRTFITEVYHSSRFSIFSILTI